MTSGEDAGPRGEGPAPEAEAWALIDALFDGRSTPEGRRRLHRWVTTQPEVARTYARAACLWALLPRNVRRPEHPAAMLARFDAGVDGPPDPAVLLSEAMILPALRDPEPAAAVDAADDDDDPVARVPPAVGRPAGRSDGSAGARRPLWAAVGGLAAAAAAAVAVVWLAARPPARTALDPAGTRIAPPAPRVVPTGPPAPVPPRPAAAAAPAMFVTATAGAAWDRATAAVPGVALAAGQGFELSRGGLELANALGAVVVVRAPAQVRVIGRDQLELQGGALAAHVPPPAVGFTVVSPGLSVVDRGTNFGVRATGNVASEVAVFDGAVDAAPANADPAAAAAWVRVTARHAVTHAVGGTAPPTAAGYEPAGYLRSLADLREPVPCRGTGQGLAAGTADPAWQVVAVPGRPDWRPAAAVVAVPDPDRHNPNSAAASWVFLSARMPDATPGPYRLRTTIDLAGFDPATASVAANLVGDGQVVDVRVDGVSTSAQNPPLGNRSPQSPPKRWTLEGVPWRAGANDVEVVILKRAVTRRPIGPLGLQLSWTATARPVVDRKTRAGTPPR